MFFLAVGTLCALAACSEKMEPIEAPQAGENPSSTKTVLLSASMEGNDKATKVTLSGSEFGWSEGVDKITATVTSDGGTTFSLVESSAYDAGTDAFALLYSGVRMGYAVVPSTFLTGYDGENLTITYPSIYDISSYITAGKYDAAGEYLPVPMIAYSNEGVSKLSFYSLGALVKVTMSHIPVGTKTLYITFNQVVTGPFSLSNPTPGSHSVAVTDTENSSTVSFTISAEGISAEQASHDFVLYIPVPTTTNLKIASSTVNKATVARNHGYTWSVPAITLDKEVYDGSFATTIGTFFVAPGNLLAHNDGGVIKYSFLSGIDQLKHTMGSLENDPHVLGSSISSLASLPEGDYKDMFTWEEVSSIFADGYVPGSDPASYVPTLDYLQENGEGTYKGYHFPQNHLRDPEISGHKWIVPRDEIMLALTETTDSWYDGTYKRNGDKATVGGQTGVFSAKVIVDLKETSYAAYATYGEGDEKLLPGLLLFPDGYVDQTNAITFVNNTSHVKNWNNSVENKSILTISYNAFAKMVENGAMFLPCVGVVSSSVFTGITTVTANWPWCYLLNDMAYISGGTTVKHTGENISASGLADGGRTMDMSCSVRLVREVTP